MSLLEISRSAQNEWQTSYERELSAPSAPSGMRLNGHVVIFSIATVLALATASECKSITHLPSLMYGAVLWGWWGSITSVIWKLGQRIPLASSFSLKAISIHVLVGSVLGVAHLLLLESLGFTVAGWQAHATALQIWTSLLNINRFGMELLLYGFVFGITGVVQFQIRAQRDAMKSLELERQLSAAHLRALQMQMEPHFLFNTLNAITTLVELGRQAEAVEALTHLNALLKTTLSQETPEKIPLAAKNGLGALCFSMYIEPDEATEWVSTYYGLLCSEECVPAGFAVNPELAVVQSLMCHGDEATAVERGLDGNHFIGYTLNHYYRFGDTHEHGRSRL